MTNIYNKSVLVKNGTLMGNWYEEETLREKTGAGRTLQAYHEPKKHLDYEMEYKTQLIKDNTFDRVLGERKEIPTASTNKSTYGKFSQNEKNPKEKKLAIKDKIFDDFFNTYVPSSNKGNNSSKLGYQIDDKLGNLNGESFGLKNGKESNLQSNGLIKSTKVDGFIDRFLSNYNQKESEYWTSRIDKGNLYFSNNQRRSLID